MRFHVVSLPHTQTKAAFAACAFTQKVVRFCAMMKTRGHEVVIYAGDQNEAPCDELVTCIGEDSRAGIVGSKHYTEADWGHPAWATFNARAIEEMRSRIQPQDFICLIGGWAHKTIADAFPNHISVEFGIGYAGTFAKYRVFESYAWMHMVYGAQAGSADKADGHWFDAVIPNQIDPALFPSMWDDPGNGIGMPGPDGLHGPQDWGLTDATDEERSKTAKIKRWHDLTCKQCSGDYYLYVGRLIDRKGYRIAQEVCEKLGKRLILAGPGEHVGYGEFAGEVNPTERSQLMAGAIALFAPTIYVEPFGTVHIEAQACGTPIISTDWGVFTETITNGINGYRCRTYREFAEAATACLSLDRKIIRKQALDRFGMDTVAGQYERYFERLFTLWGDGWYA